MDQLKVGRMGMSRRCKCHVLFHFPVLRAAALWCRRWPGRIPKCSGLPGRGLIAGRDGRMATETESWFHGAEPRGEVALAYVPAVCWPAFLVSV